MTPSARRTLQELADDDDCDLVQERGVAYCGDRRTTTRVIDELIRLTAIKVNWCDQSGGGYISYGINETGLALLRRPDLEQELQRAIAARAPFSIINDRIEQLR